MQASTLERGIKETVLVWCFIAPNKVLFGHKYPTAGHVEQIVPMHFVLLLYFLQHCDEGFRWDGTAVPCALHSAENCQRSRHSGTKEHCLREGVQSLTSRQLATTERYNLYIDVRRTQSSRSLPQSLSSFSTGMVAMAEVVRHTLFRVLFLYWASIHLSCIVLFRYLQGCSWTASCPEKLVRANSCKVWYLGT